MTKENGQGLGEPLLTSDTARTLLIATGRAADTDDGGLDVDVDRLDSIGLAALQIHLSGEPDALSRVIEQTTGQHSVLSPRQLGDLVMTSVCPQYKLTQPVAETI